MSQNAIDEIEQRLSPELAMMRAERERIAGLDSLNRPYNPGGPPRSPRRIQHGGGGTYDVPCFGTLPDPKTLIGNNFVCFRNLLIDVSSDSLLQAAVGGSEMLLDLCVPTTDPGQGGSLEVPLAIIVHGQVATECPPQMEGIQPPAGYQQFLDLLATLAARGIAAASIMAVDASSEERQRIFLRGSSLLVEYLEQFANSAEGMLHGILRASRQSRDRCFIGHSAGGLAAIRAGAVASPPVGCVIALAPALNSVQAPVEIPRETALMTLVGTHDDDVKMSGSITTFENTRGQGFRLFSIVSGADHARLGAMGPGSTIDPGTFYFEAEDILGPSRAAAFLAVAGFLQYQFSDGEITDPILPKLFFGANAIAPIKNAAGADVLGFLKHLQRPQFRPVLDDAFPLSPGRAAVILDSSEIQDSESSSLPPNITVPHAGSFRQFRSGPLHELTGPPLSPEQLDLGLDQGEFLPLCDEGDVDAVPATSNTPVTLRRGMRFDWDFPSFPTALEMAVIQVHLGATLHSLLDWAGLGPGRLQDKFLLVDAALIVNAGSNIRQQRNLATGFQTGERATVVPWRPLAALASGPLPPTSLDQWVEPTAPLPNHLGYSCALYLVGGSDLRMTSLSTAVFRISDLVALGNLDASSIFLRLSDAYRPLGAAFVSDISLAWLVD